MDTLDTKDPGNTLDIMDSFAVQIEHPVGRDELAEIFGVPAADVDLETHAWLDHFESLADFDDLEDLLPETSKNEISKEEDEEDFDHASFEKSDPVNPSPADDKASQTTKVNPQSHRTPALSHHSGATVKHAAKVKHVATVTSKATRARRKSKRSQSTPAQDSPARRARLACGLSLRKAAKKARCTVAYIRQIEQQEKGCSLIIAQRLSAIYNDCPLTDFLPSAPDCSSSRRAKQKPLVQKQGGGRTVSS